MLLLLLVLFAGVQGTQPQRPAPARDTFFTSTLPASELRNKQAVLDTAYGTIVLHVTPEAALAGPLALVRTGDQIRLSVSEGRLDLLVPPDELEKRRADLPASAPPPVTGYRKLFRDHVLGADQGCDFDFCLPGS